MLTVKQLIAQLEKELATMNDLKYMHIVQMQIDNLRAIL
jgi:hypothetical protein